MESTDYKEQGREEEDRQSVDTFQSHDFDDDNESTYSRQFQQAEARQRRLEERNRKRALAVQPQEKTDTLRNLERKHAGDKKRDTEEKKRFLKKEMKIEILKKNGDASAYLLNTMKVYPDGNITYRGTFIYKGGALRKGTEAFAQFRDDLNAAEMETNIAQNVKQTQRVISQISQEVTLEDIQKKVTEVKQQQQAAAADDDRQSVVAQQQDDDTQSLAPSEQSTIADTVVTSAPTVSSILEEDEEQRPASREEQLRLRLGRISRASIINSFSLDEKSIFYEPYDYFKDVENTRKLIQVMRNNRKEAVQKNFGDEVKNLYDRFIIFLKEQNRLNEERLGLPHDDSIDREEPEDRRGVLNIIMRGGRVFGIGGLVATISFFVTRLILDNTERLSNAYRKIKNFRNGIR